MKSLIFFVLLFVFAGAHAAFAQGADATGGGGVPVASTGTTSSPASSPESGAAATGTPVRPAAGTAASAPVSSFSTSSTTGALATTSDVVVPTSTPLVDGTPAIMVPEPTPAPLTPEPAPEVPNDTAAAPQTANTMSVLPVVAAAGVILVLGVLLALRTKKKSTQKEDPCAALKKEYETAQTAYDLALKNITLQELLIAELKKKMEDAENILKEKVKEYAADVTHEIMEDAVGKKTSEELSKAVALADEAKAAFDDLSEKYKLANDLLEILKGRQEGLVDGVREKETAWKLCTQSAALAAGGSESGKVLPTPEGRERIMHGIIVENSLRDKSILEKLTITHTRNEGDWVLHDVETDEAQALLMQNFLNDGPWYVHFWEEGSDEIIVVFKDKIFRIIRSDKDTWKEAVAHGMSLNIPETQLDFAVTEKAS